MSLYVDTDVDECPEITLECWSIREVNGGNRHFVGSNIIYQDGRVSTPIVSFDPRTRLGVTSSGRLYRLLGRAGINKDAEYVWNRVLSIWEISSWTDVTQQLCPDWRNPVPEVERAVDESRSNECLAPPTDAEGD